jgi:dual specificity phosphatase 12
VTTPTNDQTNIVSLLRPRLSFPPQFNVYALEIDDAMDTDILTHLPGAVQWVEEALSRRAARIEDGQQADNTKKGSVLVHCQAGVSRSSTVVAACLMRAKDLDPVEAVELIRQQRAHVEWVQLLFLDSTLTCSPSETFWKQLELYHASNGKVSLKDRSTRKFYMERTTTKFMSESSITDLEAYSF